MVRLITGFARDYLNSVWDPMNKSLYKSDFLSFRFSPVLLAAVKKAGYHKATDVQLETIPAVLEGKDVLVRAETGSGKTAAYVLPLLERLIDRKKQDQGKQDPQFKDSDNSRGNSVHILVLVPTRELAIQIREVFEQFSEHFESQLKCLSVYGGVKINPQMMALRGGADILVATPGRFLDLENQNAIKLNRLKTLVVDEADRLMKGDFKDEINRIYKMLPNKRQNLMFTATFPESIRTLVREMMNKPVIINIDETLENVTIEQRVITVNHEKKNDLLAYLLNEYVWKQVLVFCSAKKTCDNLVNKLEKRGINAVAMHGNQQQNARAAGLRDFKSGKIPILVATDVAARGIDIEQLPCVINYDLPRSPNDYIHRIGRTGRAGESGLAISLISHHEYQHFGVIEKRNDIRLEREQIKGYEADKKVPPPPASSKSKRKANLARKKNTSKNKKLYGSIQPERKQLQEKSKEKQPAVNAHIWGR